MKEKAENLMNAIYSEDEVQKNKIAEMRNSFAIVTEHVLSNMKDSREKSLALTKLEESCMWAIKGITRE